MDVGELEREVEKEDGKERKIGSGYRKEGDELV